MSTLPQQRQISWNNGYHPTPSQFEQYRHSPLPTPTPIRLLSFVKLEDSCRAISFDGTPLLEVNLTTVSLDDIPPFKCLSYTWGNWEQKYPGLYDGYQASVKRPIIVNGRLLYVTRNLHDALWQFGPWGQWHVDGRFEPYNKTELIRAAEEGQGQAVRRLLQKGANVNSRDKFGETALHYAAENGHLHVVEVLLTYGASADVIDDAGRTPRDCCLQHKRGEWSKVVDALDRHTQSARPVSARPAAVYPLTTRLWADAICIDQQNSTERTSQVTLMSRIYSSAESVLVWLGLPDASTQPAWEFFTYAFSETNEARPDCGILVGKLEKATYACHVFFCRRWFWRRWVIQEMALAHKLEVFCGSYEFDWDRISLAILEYQFTITSPPTLDEPTYLDLTKNFGFGHSAQTPYTLSYIRLRTQSALRLLTSPSLESNGKSDVQLRQASKLSLQILLILSWRFDTADSRDRIYGLLGVAGALENRPPIHPDYSRPVSDLYIEVGRLFVEAPGTHQVHNHQGDDGEEFEPLEGLSFVQGTSCGKHVFDPLHPSCACVVQRLPSWVPDFSGPLSTIRIHRKRFHASASHKARFYPSSPAVIKLDACCVDHIVDAENDPVHTKTRSGEGIRFCEPLSWLEVTAKFDVVSATGQNRAEVLWRTLMVDDVLGDPDVAKRDFKKLFCEDFARNKLSFWKRKKFLSLLEQLHNTDDSGSLPSTTELNQFCKTYDPSKHQQIITCNDEGNFRWRFAEIVRKRGLLRTRNGLMGFGPRWTVPGDEVWLLAGARTPYILRKLTVPGKSDCHRMIGEVYVHGIMYGELCKAQDLCFRPIEIH